MELTKLGHSCVRLSDGDHSLVIDPGVFSDADAALDGASAVLITHEHPDHIDADRLSEALRDDPRRRVWAPASVAGGALAEFGEQVVGVGPGDEFEAGGLPVRAFGGQHAVIHPQIPVVANNAYLVGGSVYHPGDSLIVPPVAVTMLLLPVNAPWSKSSEVVDFAVSVRAPYVHQIHDGLVNERYFGIVENQLRTIAGPHGVEYAHLDDGASVELAGAA